MNLRTALLGTLALSVVLAGCGETAKPDAPAAAGKGSSTKKAMRVGVVFDSGGKGDKSFNDSAYAGVERAKKEFGVEEKLVDSQNARDYENNLTELAESGTELIVAVGGYMQRAVETVAPQYPETKFVLVDAEVQAPNVRNVLFAEEQGSYLAGVAAALATKTNKVGFVGGMKIPLIKKFEAGYFAGVKAGKPGIEALKPKYTESWDDTALGRASAAALYAQGADVVYHAAGRCGLGVIEAAKAAGKLAIGVDSDQDAEAKGFVLTSMVKRVDEAVYQSIKDLKGGAFTAGSKLYDLKAKGVGLTEFKYTLDRIGGEAGKARLAQVTEDIVSGKVTVPTTP